MEKTYTTQDWIQAYEEKVQDVLNYQGYNIKSNAKKHFERLKNLYPDVNPFTFMVAMFDPNNWWGIPGKKKGWKKLKYPFPTMLVGSKSENIYHKYVKNRKKEVGNKHDEILGNVKVSLDKLKVLQVELDDLAEIYHLTVDGTLSPYLTACLKGIFTWYILKCNKGETDSAYYKELKKTMTYLNNHGKLKVDIRELLEVYDRN